jgi:hypothetical protein
MAHVEQSSAVLRVLRTSTEVARKGAARSRAVYFAVLGLILSLFTIGSTMSMGFSNIDDHERLGWIGPDGRVPTARLADILLSTEVGYVATPCIGDAPCSRGRFRVVYYAFLIAETWVFGESPAPYFALRIGIFALFLAAVGWASGLALGYVAATALAIYVSSMKFWGGFWTYSLGAGEQVAILGFALVVLGAAQIVAHWYRSASDKLDGPLGLMGLGTFIAMGSKENFFFLFGGFVLCFAYCLRSHALSRRGLVLALAALGACIALAAGEVAAFRLADNWGGDMRGLSLWGRLSIFWKSWLISFPIAIALIGLSMLFASRHRWVRSRVGATRAVTFGGVVAVIGSVYSLWETFFYGGFGGGGAARYAFPGLLIVPFGLGLMLFLVRVLADAAPASRAARPSLYVATCLLVLVWPGHAWTFPVRAEVASRVEQTARFAADLARTADVMREHPDWPLLVDVAARPYDKEAVSTLNVWLRRARVHNATVLRVRRLNTGAPHGPFEEKLLRDMEKWARDGAPGKYFSPERIDQGAIARGECYVISMRLPSETTCTPVALRPEQYWN